jgi:predicted outer membrane protein
MSASFRTRAGVAAAGLCCLLLTRAIAQERQATGQRQPASSAAERDYSTPAERSSAAGQIERSRTSTQPGQPYTANFRGAQTASSKGEVEQFLAGCLLAKNKAEIELSQLAEKQAENPKVKEFAQQMVKDHQKMVQSLEPLAMKSGQSSATTTSGIETRTDSSTPRLDTGAETSTTVATQRTSGANSAIHELMQIDRQIAERVLQAHREELQQKSGAEFDKCYIASAIGAHMHAVAALEVIGQHGQGQLSQLAQQSQPTVQKHLEHAKQLMKQLEGKSAEGDTGTESQSTRVDR